MKHTYLLLLLLVLLATAGLVSADSGYAIDWHTIDSGGQTAASDSGYAIIGTFGQPDAGRLTGSPSAVAGGFWNRASYVPTAIALRQMGATTATASLLGPALLVMLLLTLKMWRQR